MANEPSEEIKLSFSPPLAPQNLTATGRTSQAALSWSPPLSNGNNTITGYQVSIDNGETWVAAHGMSNHIFTLENITQDTEFTFNVRAQNRLGAGEEASVTLIIGLPVYCEECELDKIDCICCTICRKLECICPPPILCDECGEEKDISPCCGWCVDCDNEYGYIQCPECSGCSWCFDFCNMCGECLDCCECPHICYLCGEEKEIVCPLCEWCVDCNELFGYVHCPSCDWCDFCNDLAGYVHCPDCGWCDWCSWCSICGECKNCCDCCEECRQIDCVCCDICEKYPCECIPLPVVTSVTVSPSSLTMEPGETYMFNAIVDGTNNPPQDVTWDIAGNSHIETMITSSGALSVHLNETATTLAVTAHSTLAGYTSISGAAIVMITHNVDINEINFPDEIFRTWLLNHPFGQNGILTTAEIAALNEINVAGLGITDLTGIEHFTALHTLYCNDNELIALDVSKNTGLMKLFVNNNYMADESAITGIENIIAFTAWDTDDFLFFPQHPKPGITTTSLPGGVFDIFYTHTLAVAGNVFFWSVEDGDLPDGLTLSEIGVISGMPEKAGTFTFTVKAPNPAGSDTRVFSITIGKANQNTPLGIGSTHETSPGANDGTITGVTTGMEYKLSTDTTYTAISGTTVTGLAPGMYYVRYAETANLNAGADTNVTVYAFTALTHAINVIGGTASPPTAAAGDTVVLTANPPEGYTFNNWEVVSPLGLIITNNTFIMPDEPVFAEAVFKQISDNAHDIIIINGGENASASPNPADEGDEVSLYAGTRAGHTFSHWTGETFTASSPGALDMVQIFNMDLYIEKADCPTSATFIMPNEPVEVTAHWELSLWRVAFDLAGGVYAGNQELIEQFIPHGSDATPLSQNPTRDGHMFMGWSQPLTDLMNIIEERIFTAQWEELSDGEFTVQWPGNSVKFMKLSVDVEDNYEGANFTGATVTIEVTGALPNDLLEIKIPVSFTVYVGSGDEDITVDAVIRMRTNNLGKGSNSLVVKLEDILAGTAATGSDGFNGIINTPTVNLVEGFVLGSVTQSGRVTSADATALARWLIADPADRSALEESLNFCKYAADMDATNKVVLQDLTTLQRWLVGHNVSALQ
ncbi:MAG: fibronectin type III domain-containing protein [Defluviitaleaceae bacterium]|nr:fibronectin type III domain-containing protein [Defluviitaleaceae bacterium]